MAQVTSVLSPTHVNEFRFQFAREIRPQDPIADGPSVTVRNAGTIIGSYGPVASNSSFNNVSFRSTDNRFQLTNNLSTVAGPHTLKVGFDFNNIDGDLTFNGGYNGSYDFQTLQDFLNRTPRQYSQFTGTGKLSLTVNQLAFYAQDEWRIAPNVTLSPGFRYEAQFNPDYLPATEPGNRVPYATHIPSDKSMYAPRLGLSWNLTGDGRTVIRAGGGLFYAATNVSTLAQSMLFNGGNPDRAFSVTVTNAAALTNAFRSIGVDLARAPLDKLPVLTPAQLYQAFGAPGAAAGRAVNYTADDYRNPKALQWQLSGERELATNLKAGIGYTYVNTVRVARQRDTNLPAPRVDVAGRNIYDGVRPLSPKFGITQAAESSSRALYRGLTTSFNARRSRFTWDAYYTLSWNKTFDDIERSLNINYADANNMIRDYNFSNIDERHQFITNSVWFLPHGFDVSTTARFASGRPFSASAGSDVNSDGQVRDRATINGQLALRNSYRNFGFRDISLRVQRSFALPNERGRIIISGEAFNAFAFDNYLMGGSSTTYGPGVAIQNGSAVILAPPAAFLKSKDADGHLLRTGSVGDPVQVQLGLRFEF